VLQEYAACPFYAEASNLDDLSVKSQVGSREYPECPLDL
jgi:hypothetical protein